MSDAPATTAGPQPTRAKRHVASLHALHGGITINRYYAMHLTAAVFPLSAGMLLYGWRAGLVIVIVLLSALLAAWVWRQVGRRGQQIHWWHVVWLSILLAMMLPAHLAGEPDAGGVRNPYLLLPAVGISIVTFLWILGGLGAARVHPALVAFLLLVVLYGPALQPGRLLQRNRLFTGDLLHAPRPGAPSINAQPWIHIAPIGATDAHWVPSAAYELQRFTTAKVADNQYWLTIDVLLRDHLPPLEDLIVAGQPTSIGNGSTTAIIIGGLFLLYRGLIDFRIPLLIFASAYVALLVLPIPIVITDEPQYQWAWPRVGVVNWQTALTFVHYELLASPLTFVAFFIATAPNIRPLSKPARTIYATMTGVLAAALQLYCSVLIGPYIALLLASLVTPALDKWLGQKPLV